MRRTRLLIIALALAGGVVAAGCSQRNDGGTARDIPEAVRVDKKLNAEKEKIRQAEDLRKLNDQKAQDIISQ